jgi:hypothetical protein
MALGLLEAEKEIGVTTKKRARRNKKQSEPQDQKNLE